MLVDHRTYTVKPGTMARQLALYQEYGSNNQPSEAKKKKHGQLLRPHPCGAHL